MTVKSQGMILLHNLDLVADVDPEYEKLHELVESLTGVYGNHEVNEGVQLTLYELLENAIKYSTAHPPGKIRFSFSVNHVHACVMIRNRCISLENIRALTRTIDEINLTDGDALYESRMRDLFEDPYQDRVRLGLLRIVVEAGFSLQYIKTRNFIEVIATRKLGKRKENAAIS